MKEAAGGNSALALLREAAQWRLLGLLLARPTAERRAEVRRLAAEVGDAPLAAVAEAWCANATEGAYLQLLGPGGLVPAREVAYRPFADPGWILSDLARHHDAFAFRSNSDEPSDHISVLADFVSYLLLKEAYARETTTRGEDETTRTARLRFTDEHLAPAAGRIAERLVACGATNWSAAAQILADRVPAPPAVAPAPPTADSFVCGACNAEPAPAPTPEIAR